MAIEIQLWDESLTIQLVTVHDALASSFRDARGEPGTGSLTVPYTVEYRDLLARDLVVVHVQDGVRRFAWVIEQDTVQPFGERPSITASGRGLLCWLSWSVIYPARGLRRRSPSERYFGFGAGDVFASGFGSAFSAPVVSPRTDVPSGWPEASMETMWPAGQGVTPPAGQAGWFYRGFVTEVGQRVRIDATGDDAVEVWIDDQKIIDIDGRDRIDPGSNMMSTWRGILPAGTHWVMVKGRQLDSDDTADLGIVSPGDAWVAVRIASIAADDDPGTLILQAGSTWNATLEEPGWNAGLSLLLMLQEAFERGVDRLFWTAYAFDNNNDANGVELPHNVNRTWPVGTDYLKFVTELQEFGVDIWATPDKVLRMAVSRGVDRSDVVHLSPGKHLSEFGVVRNHQVRTYALVNTADGWTQVSDGAGLATHGRAEVRLDLNSVDSLYQAMSIADGMLAPLASPTRETDGDSTSLVPWVGAVPYRDFGVADVVSVPDGEGGYASARVQAVTWRLGDPQEWFLELDLAQKGARRRSPTAEQRVLAIASSGGAASVGGRIQSASK